MTGAIYAAAAGEFFGAVSDIVSLLPQFDERKKKMIEKETRILIAMEESFNKAAVEFDISSRPDELLGLADAYKSQEKKLKNLIKLYASELKK